VGTPKRAINPKRCHDKNAGIVIAMRERVVLKLAQSKRHDEWQSNTLPNEKREILRPKLAKWLVTQTTDSLAYRRIALRVRSKRVEFFKRFVGSTRREHAI
jgi:hypothetical protein